MGDDFQIRIGVHDLGINEPHHGAGRLVGPAEGPPDFVERFVFVDVVRHFSAARRMQPDRRPELVHFLPERRILRPVERLAGDVGVNLHAERAVFQRALGFADAGVGSRQRDLRHPTGETIFLLGGQFGEAVIDDAAELVDVLRRLGELFDRRLRIGQDLLIVLMAVDDLLADIEVVQSRQRAHALAHVLVVADGVVELVEELLRKKVGICVNTHGHEQFSPFAPL